MAADPNWFYSTLAQSTAAIIGVAGGFMVNRVIQQRNEIADDRAYARQIFEATWSSIVETRERAERIIKGGSEAVSTARAAFETGAQVVNIPARRLASFSHTPGWTTIDYEVEMTAENVEQLQGLVELATDLRDALPSEKQLGRDIRHGRGVRTRRVGWYTRRRKIPWVLDPHHESTIHGATIANFVELLPEQEYVLRNIWWSWTQNAEKLRTKLDSIRARIAAPTLYGLVAVLAALLVAGLIAPLFFLSARADRSRDVLVTIFAVLASAFVLFLANEIRRLSRALNLERVWW